MSASYSPPTEPFRASYSSLASPFASSTTAFRSRLRSAPALALDATAEDAVRLRCLALIEEAIAVNHAQTPKQKTLDKYAKHLDHFDAYMTTVHRISILGAKRKHISLFMRHLEVAGGSEPHELRRDCEWCAARGYPNGRGIDGWTASTRKGYLSALRFFYRHCLEEEDLPDFDPTARMPCPKVVTVQGYTPSRDEVQRLFDAPGKPKDRLLAYWLFYAPSRRETFAAARWSDLDLDAGRWRVVGKGDKPDEFDLHPRLRHELKKYRRWQLAEASRNPAIRDALSVPETAFVLLTRNGQPTAASSIAKTIQRRAIRAGIGVRAAAPGSKDSPGGKKTLLTPHSLRRAWATFALNDPRNPAPIDVVAEVLNHKDIATTRRHYAGTKPERARKALLDMRL